MSPASYRAAPPRVGPTNLLCVLRRGKSPVSASGAEDHGLAGGRRLRRWAGPQLLLRLRGLLQSLRQLLLRRAVGREVAALERLLTLLVRRVRLRQGLLQLLLRTLLRPG